MGNKSKTKPINLILADKEKGIISSELDNADSWGCSSMVKHLPRSHGLQVQFPVMKQTNER